MLNYSLSLFNFSLALPPVRLSLSRARTCRSLSWNFSCSWHCSSALACLQAPGRLILLAWLIWSARLGCLLRWLSGIHLLISSSQLLAFASSAAFPLLLRAFLCQSWFCCSQCTVPPAACLSEEIGTFPARSFLTWSAVAAASFLCLLMPWWNAAVLALLL